MNDRHNHQRLNHYRPKPHCSIAVIGDVHNLWDITDNQVLQHLDVDLALFVGDFGNEAVGIVQTIVQLTLPYAVILGNHDAWYSASRWGQKQCPYDRNQEDRVQQQLDILGEAHVGFGKRDFPELGLSVVGSRPFSWGGPGWKNQHFLRERCGVSNFTESTARIVSAAKSTQQETLIFLGHNGPQGLGDQPEDICGQDWQPLGGDHGDPDFAAAIAQTRALGKQIPLVTFGHMHHRLRHTQSRLRTMIHQDSHPTIYLNAATVPRRIDQGGDRWHHFSLITLQQAQIQKITQIWVNHQGQKRDEQRLYSKKNSLLLAT